MGSTWGVDRRDSSRVGPPTLLHRSWLITASRTFRLTLQEMSLAEAFNRPDQPWVVGILHPESNTEVVRTVELTECSIATSGLFERGNHIIDPHRGVHEVRLDSATVIGPDGGLADALATALLLEGEDGLRFFAGLSDWSGYLMRGGRASHFGPAFETSPDCRGEIPTQRSTS